MLDPPEMIGMPYRTLVVGEKRERERERERLKYDVIRTP
jgi:hypothetical protein